MYYRIVLGRYNQDAVKIPELYKDPLSIHANKPELSLEYSLYQS